MEAYMKHQFTFLGVTSPNRKKQTTELIKQTKKEEMSHVLLLIDDLFNREEREYQYVAIEICVANEKRLEWSDILLFTRYVQEKSWWDSVDSWRKVFGLYIKRHPDKKEAVFSLFFKHENMWMRRISIILQLNEKEKTDNVMLKDAIQYDLKTDEFFIQKAIGWSLRQYSKTNSIWVSHFIEQNELSRLAEREGSKYL